MDAVEGRDAIKEFIAGFTVGFEGIDFQVHRQVSDGNLVMNERTDVMRRKDAEPISLPVTGVFEIEDGKIAAWRDYFDMATITASSVRRAAAPTRCGCRSVSRTSPAGRR